MNRAEAARASELAAEGIAKLEARRFEEAAEAFLSARRLDPASPELAFNLGLARLRDGRARDARAAFEEALALGGEDADLLCNLGLALFETGKEADAERAYLRALELEPGHPEAANDLGVLLFGRGLYDRARELFASAATKRRDYYDAWFNLRDACAELGLEAERSAAQAELDRLGGRA
ncbi:MAG TPA: tetratricopeptide repeat protein [Spirochaetales bacterium]|nr:tetratricopeptide repeat protein [Spirochaetales bacterium]